MEERLGFAKTHLENDCALLSHVIWSDETKVRAHPRTGDITYWVHSSTRREDMPHNLMFHSGGISVMFWGCFSKLALGPLVVVEGNMDAKKYIQTLKDNLLNEYAIAKKTTGEDWVFMQDNAPCHRAKSVVRFLRRNRIKTLEWPPQSPDLNPIENLWSIIKREMKRKLGPPTTKDELIEQVFNVWESMDQSICGKLLDEYEKRLNAVLLPKGRATKY